MPLYSTVMCICMIFSVLAIRSNAATSIFAHQYFSVRYLPRSIILDYKVCISLPFNILTNLPPTPHCPLCGRVLVHQHLVMPDFNFSQCDFGCSFILHFPYKEWHLSIFMLLATGFLSEIAHSKLMAICLLCLCQLSFSHWFVECVLDTNHYMVLFVVNMPSLWLTFHFLHFWVNIANKFWVKIANKNFWYFWVNKNS